MRNNLLSLRNISTQMDNTQLILASGKKVNSALDNPSSYYQAQSLTNRASDLSTLLDGMSQGIQVIKAANEGVESSLQLLEQMQAVTSQAESQRVTEVPAKEYFEALVGENGAVVSTAEELRDAITTGKETICVYGAIDLGDITTTGSLQLKANQKLVGVGYFGNFDTQTSKFSSITATDTRSGGNLIYIAQDGCLVDGLSINYKNMVENRGAFALRIQGTGVTATLQNLDIKAEFSDVNSGYGRAAIQIANNARVSVDGKINISTTGNRGWGIWASQSTIEINANTNIITSGQEGHGIHSYSNSTINIQNKVNIFALGHYAYGLYTSMTGNNKINITSTAEIYFRILSKEITNSYSSEQRINILEIAQGAKLAFEKDGKTNWYKVQKDYRDENTSTTTANYITADNVTSKLNVANTSPWQTPDEASNDILINAQEYQDQFNEAIRQYDKLINDTSYKGINLLKGDTLKVTFNETGEHTYLIQGQDISAQNLGISEVIWGNLGDIAATQEILQAAISTLRQLSEDLGLQFNVLQTRSDFTDALINVLETGADKLTLADMNEASAQYLSLQTRQQLAINSLSLASQASQAVLRLF